MPDPNQNQPNSPSNVNPPSIFPSSDLPPMPPAFQNIGGEQKPSEEPASATTSGAPEEKTATPVASPIISSGHKKKFGGGRIIATLLGILLLVGGVGAGLILTQQQQLFAPKAAGGGCGGCPQGYHCVSQNGAVFCSPNNNNKPVLTGPVTNSADCGVGKHLCSCAAGSACTSQDCTAYCNNPNASNPPLNTAPPSTNTGTGGNGATCSTSAPCANGYICTSGTCQPNTDGSCKTGDTGAPVCCTGTCPSGKTVCEKGQGSGRLECNIGGVHCTIAVNSSSCAGQNTGTTTTTTTSSASCQGVTAYDSSWAALTSAQLSGLAVGTSVNYCVTGTATSGSFDKAKFTINGTAGGEITTKGQGAAASAFCAASAIIAGANSVTAQIHHATLGWSN